MLDSTSEYIHKRTENSDLNRYVYSHIHSSIIHHSQKLETTQRFIDR
jgi:hypothetical protein